MLVILSGCSGVGKNTIINELLNRYGEFELLPTYTTREKRENEAEGYPYFFISNEEFEKKIEEDEFYEYQIVHNHYYGVSKKVLLSKKQLSKILIKDVDVLGTLTLLNKIIDTIKILTFFYYVDSKSILAERLKERNERNIELRLERYDMEMQLANKYDYIINNIEMETTLQMTRVIIDLEMKNKFLLPSQTIRSLNESKQNAIADEMRKGTVFPPIDVALENGELYIIDGHHRYMASILTGTRIAKRIISPDYIDKVEYYSWEDAIEYLLRTKFEKNKLR